MVTRLCGAVMVIVAVIAGKDWIYPLWLMKLEAGNFNPMETISLLLIAGSLTVLAAGLLGLKLLFGKH